MGEYKGTTTDMIDLIKDASIFGGDVPNEFREDVRGFLDGANELLEITTKQSTALTNARLTIEWLVSNGTFENGDKEHLHNASQNSIQECFDLEQMTESLINKTKQT